MIKFDFPLHKVSLSMDTNNAEFSTQHIFKGDSKAIKAIKDRLYNSYNMFGHIIGTSSPAIDVNYALFYSKDKDFFKAVINTGKEIIDDWEYPILPKGTRT